MLNKTSHKILIRNYFFLGCRLLSLGILYSFTTLFALAMENPPSAEFAIRWDPLQGGPSSAQDVITKLKLHKADQNEYSVRYFSVLRPLDTPNGYNVILRERENQKKNQLTLKYRGNTPLKVKDYKNWKCPLGSNAEKKYEVDISILSSTQENIRKAYSLSCSLEKKEPIEIPKNLEAKQIGCKSKMIRLKSGDLKVEEWIFKSNNERLIEVSMTGTDSKEDFDKFLKDTVSKLLILNVQPIDKSKSETGSECGLKYGGVL